MAKAGVRHVYVGQESGDQRIILAMKKGTSVDQVKPGVAALARNDICATFSFIHGFPGEDAASIAATRSMIVHMNDGFESRPPVLQYLVSPLQVIDFASVSRKEEMTGLDHWLGYGGSGGVTPEQAVLACYDTIIEASRVPHAPAFMIAPGEGSIEWEDALFFTPHRYELFRWYKTIERGTAIFLERAVEGTRPDDLELARIKRRILGYYDELPAWRSALAKVSARVTRTVAARLRHECLREPAEGPGLLSRTLVGLAAWRDLGRFDLARRSFEAGVYADPRDGSGQGAPDRTPGNAEALAGALLDETFSDEQRRRQLESAKKIVAPDKLVRKPAGEPQAAE
jgi:anaerobic magnesium-protoporphyrin IX monomethyl ester cyclase